MKRFFWLGSVLVVYLICTGCGDTFRPIIIPNPPIFPNPRATHTVVSINDNAPSSGQFETVPGTAMVIDVSGDSDVSVSNLGLAPVYALHLNSNQILVVNQAVTGLTPPTSGCLVTVGNQSLSVCPSLSQLSLSGNSIAGTSTVSLPPSSAPNFVAGVPSSTTAYVSLPHYIPDPSNPGVVVPSVEIVNTQSGTAVATVPVSNDPNADPYALAITPDSKKFYVANRGSGSVAGFNVISLGLTPRPLNGSFTAPTWVTARSDSQRVYVLNGNGVVSTIDTSSTAGPDQVIDASITVPGATYMLYDENLNRLYIPGTSQLTILDITPSVPAVLAGGPILSCPEGSQSPSCISPVPSSARAATDPCSGTATQAPTLVAVTTLPDGSRAYVGSYYKAAVSGVSYVCPQVTVIDAVSNTVKSSTAVTGFPDATDPADATYYVPACASARFRFMMASAGDSSRAYLSSCDGGNVNIIDTSIDSFIVGMAAPVGGRPPISPSQLNPSQNPVFLLAGP